MSLYHVQMFVYMHKTLPYFGFDICLFKFANKEPDFPPRLALGPYIGNLDHLLNLIASPHYPLRLIESINYVVQTCLVLGNLILQMDSNNQPSFAPFITPTCPHITTSSSSHCLLIKTSCFLIISEYIQEDKCIEKPT